jgi:hypothetical protein
MKKLWFTSIAIAAIAAAGSADAADLRVPRARAPAILPVYNWTGCYVGGYVGGAWHDYDGATFTDLGTANFASFSGGVAAAGLSPSHSWSADLRDSFIGDESNHQHQSLSLRHPGSTRGTNICQTKAPASLPGHPDLQFQLYADSTRRLLR